MQDPETCQHTKASMQVHCAKCFTLLVPSAKETTQQLDYKTTFDLLFSNFGMLVHHQNNAHDARVGVVNKALGVRKGMPDFQIITKNRVFFVEVKTEIGKLSKDQKTMHEYLQGLGFKVYTVHSIISFIKIIQDEFKTN